MFARQTIVRNARLFSTQVRLQKSATETVKDAAAAVNRTVSDTVVKGIEKGEQAAATIKSSTNVSSGEAKGKAHELAGEAKGKANEVAGKSDVSSGEVKGKASEIAGEAKGKFNEVAGQAKGKAEEVKGKMS